MIDQRATLRFVRFLLIGGLAWALPLLAQPAVAQDRTLDPDVEKILRERLSVLEEASRLHREAYRSGTTDFGGTLAADLAVLEARLELATTKADRVKIREEMLKNAEALEKSAEEFVKSGQGPQLNVLTARANRLRAAADLLLERKAAAR